MDFPPIYSNISEVVITGQKQVINRGANSDPYVESKFGNQNSKTDSELNSEIRFNRIRIRFGKFGIDISFQHISNTEVALS